MDRITRFSLKNGAAIVIVAILVMVGGLWSATQLEKESMPDVNIPVVTVVTPYPGAAPQDVYDQVTEPMEKALRGVAGVKRVSAQSQDSVSMVVVEFSYSQDMEKAQTDVNKVVPTVKLPDNAITPTVSRISFGSTPVLKIALSAKGGDAEKLRSEVRESVIPALKGVEGVGSADLAADAANAVRITFDPVKLKKKGLTAAAVVQQLQAANLAFPVGALDLPTTSEPVRVAGAIDSVEAVRDFTIAVYPDSNSYVGKALAAIGSGMGQGFSALGAGMGQLGAATGQIGMQAGLINGIQQLQAQMYSLKYDTLPGLKSAASSTTSGTPEHDQLLSQIEQIEKTTLPGMQAAINGMQAQISASQASLAGQAKGTRSTSSGGLSMSSSGLKPSIKTVKLSDVAEVSYGPADGTVGSRANGDPAALIDIIKTQDANTVVVTEKVKAEVARVVKTLPDKPSVEYVYDGSVSINDSVNGMLREGLLGAIFAVIVILLFLRNWRATLIATVSIPLSILIAMAALGRTGITLNVMTLGGLTVAIGRVVDDAIVVIENVYRHLQSGAPRTAETVRKATAEVSSAITSSTLTTVAVFIPLGLVSGIIGKIFQPFAETVGIALLASLLVAVTVVPLMARWMLLRGKIPQHRGEEARPSRRTVLYRGLLGWALDHRAIVLVAAAALLAGSVALMPLVGTGFVPESKEKFLQITVTHPQGTKAVEVDKTVRALESSLAKTKGVDFYQSVVGAAGGGVSMSRDLGGTNKATVFVRLDPEVDTQTLLDEVRKSTDALQVGGVEIATTAIGAGMSTGTLDIVVTGDNLATIRKTSDDVVAALKTLPDLENVASNLGTSRPQIAVNVDEAKAAKYGLNAAMVAGAIRGLVAEQKAGSIKIDGQPTDLMYRTDTNDIDPQLKLSDLTLMTPLGKKIDASEVATIEETGSPVGITTRDGVQYATVSGHVTKRDSGSVIKAVKAKIAELTVSKGVKVEVSGQAEMMAESFQQLGLAMLIAIGAVYLVMVIAFGEATAPLAILMSLPLAVVGGLIGLLIAGVPLDMPAMVGALMLIGIVVTNAIVLVDRVRTNSEGGMPRREALLEAGSTRMRPIIMTAVATVMALLPLAAGNAEGALVSQSLAVIVIGGLTTSTLLTLVVVPVTYDLLEGVKDRLFGGHRAQEDPPAETI